jgi:DNA-binding beta-propeller fold protein YncE
MKTSVTPLLVLLSLAAPLLAAQPAPAPSGPTQSAPAAATAMPGRATERASAERLAALKTGPALPYKVDPNWPRLPKGHNFGEATGVDIDKQGNVWVLNRGHWPLMKFDRSGKLLDSWTSDTLHFVSTHGLRVGPDGNLWAVDVDGHIVIKLNPEGRILMILGQRQGVAGNNDAEDAFNRPTNVNFRANGNIYISDGYVNGRVVEYTGDGAYVKHWGKRGRGDSEFNLVHDVAVDKQGRVYVADRTNERVQVFDADGKFITKWTGLGSPWGLYYVEKENAIYMCDGTYARILKLSMDGEILGVLSSYGRAPGKVDYVHAIAVDPTDLSIYTTEIKSWRVQKWVRDSR